MPVTAPDIEASWSFVRTSPRIRRVCRPLAGTRRSGLDLCISCRSVSSSCSAQLSSAPLAVPERYPHCPDGNLRGREEVAPESERRGFHIDAGPTARGYFRSPGARQSRNDAAMLPSTEK